MTPQSPREKIEKTLNEEIVSLLFASCLFHSQISDTGGKTINFPVFQEHLGLEIDKFRIYFFSTLSTTLERIVEEIGEDENQTIMMNGDIYIQAGRNQERQRIRSLIRQHIEKIR